MPDEAKGVFFTYSAHTYLIWAEMEIIWPFAQYVEGGLELEAIPEQPYPSKDVEAEPGSRHGHDETTDVTQVADILCFNQAQQNVVILLTLKLVHRRDFVGPSNQRVIGASESLYTTNKKVRAQQTWTTFINYKSSKITLTKNQRK